MVNRLRDLLAEDELARSRRFRFDRDRNNFIVARSFLRLILCHYIHVDPRQLRFGYGEYGKPVLLDQGRGPTLRFNLSHSAELALYAISDKREVGIDVEGLKSTLSFQEIADRVFSPRETATIRALPTEKRREAFFHGWTRKEAFVKARGEGLSFPLAQFEVPLYSDGPATFLGEIGGRESASGWSLYNLSIARGYCAALVVEGGRCGLRFWEYFPDEKLSGTGDQ
jgi:4'-phosphopantetheinyl transferase